MAVLLKWDLPCSSGWLPIQYVAEDNFKFLFSFKDLGFSYVHMRVRFMHMSAGA